ncbi:MAG: segregation/condensation protein A [Firmicutes bacterium]|nr:segregation/condensation protein A [Bacillota bacterium]
MFINRTSSEVKVKLEDFEGPLDLLLSIIRDKKLDIKTVPLASVTGQYMEFLSGLDALNLDLASEFIEVGATLVEIKSKQILPKPRLEEEETAEELEARLRARLEEYALLKEAGEKLREHETLGRFYKPAEPIKEIIKYTMDGVGMEDLVTAFTKMIQRLDRKAPPPARMIRLDRFSVSDKMAEVRRRLEVESGFSVFSLLDEESTKSEVINVFLALLELLKMNEIRVVQESKFGEIVIEKGQG